MLSSAREIIKINSSNIDFSPAHKQGFFARKQSM